MSVVTVFKGHTVQLYGEEVFIESGNHAERRYALLRAEECTKDHSFVPTSVCPFAVLTDNLVIFGRHTGNPG